MSKRPWYIWLSLLAFFIISYRCKRAIIYKKPMDYSLWHRCMRTELFWGIITLIIPAAIIVLLMCIVSNYGYIWELSINIAGLIYLYFGGVFFSAKLYDWEQENTVLK